MKKDTKEKQLFFQNEDSTFCYPLSDHFNEAKEDGLDEVELIEAIPSNSEDHVWCTYHGEVVERSECKKSECQLYHSKSGRGVCEHRGSYFLHGEKVKFKVPYIDHISSSKPLDEETTQVLNNIAKQAYKTK